MIKKVLKIFGSFAKRMQKDHLGAYAATCAYFLMISFVPFIMIFTAIAGMTHMDVPELMGSFSAIIPSGLKGYIDSVILEVNTKSYIFMPLSVLILIWSASKVLHALTNGLNVISRVQETRGWFFLRFRSMFFVGFFFMIVTAALILSVFGQSIRDFFLNSGNAFGGAAAFFYRFRALFGYIGLIFLFLFIYKFLPNCHYTFRSQFPGALLVSTIWVFVSYLLTLYYEHNQNFNDIYGSSTSMMLAMIWLYFCCFFLLFGAELNRVIYEDPEDNIIVNTLGAVKDASVKRQLEIKEELDEHSIWRPLSETEDDLPVYEPKDIEIPWTDEDEEARAEAERVLARIMRSSRIPREAKMREAELMVAKKTLPEKKETKTAPALSSWTAGAIANGNNGSSETKADEKVVNLLGGSNEWN